MVAVISPLVAEALAIKNGITSTADVGPIIVEISNALQSLPSCSNSHVPCKGNVVAHVLAEKAMSVESEYCWIDFCPPCTERIVQLDASL
ncbi:hypothetical protein LWI29_027948 [Acer saccharum]|uniref:RNase H type-1 domain-containing protein n=1 Tax=Acer saccharum TaxID=4024 RepID=A0AA39TA40_ACESA|nr:hypothetical protein LWI29_027948 [Acer saccharum]